ncbi:MAG: hypothetical protein IPP06_12615 [Saprospiraceae bacterium]|nr:hypothetical protein [Candidatus Vicinibacter affinis]
MTGDIPMLNADPTQVTFSLGYLNTGTWKWNPNGGVSNLWQYRSWGKLVS